MYFFFAPFTMENILSEIQRAAYIEDPIEQRNAHKEILVKVTNNPTLYTNRAFHNFLLESFKMFHDDNYYDICVNILKQTYVFLDLSLFTDVINDLCTNKHANFGYELKSKLQKRKSDETTPKRKSDEATLKRKFDDTIPKRKKVSFNTKVEIKYYEPFIQNNALDTERITENKRQMKNNSFEEIDWYTPERIDNVEVIQMKTDESIAQNKRESENINFTNTEMHSKCVPSDCTNKNELLKNEAIELPVVNLKLQNVYKKLDFVKIIKNKDLDLAALFDDPEIMKILK